MTLVVILCILLREREGGVVEREERKRRKVMRVMEVKTMKVPANCVGVGFRERKNYVFYIV